MEYERICLQISVSSDSSNRSRSWTDRMWQINECEVLNIKINDDTTRTSESQDLHTTHMSSYKASRCYGFRNQSSKGAVNDNMSGSWSKAKGKRL